MHTRAHADDLCLVLATDGVFGSVMRADVDGSSLVQLPLQRIERRVKARSNVKILLVSVRASINSEAVRLTVTSPQDCAVGGGACSTCEDRPEGR